MLSDDSSSDDDEEIETIAKGAIAMSRYFFNSDSDSSESSCKWGGSRPGRSPNIKRDFAGANEMIIRHYFSGEDSLYDEGTFEKRYTCPRHVIMCIYEAVHGHDPFILKTLPNGQLGIRPLVRFTACMRMLKYGDNADRLDEHLQISESEAARSLPLFCRLVVDKFKDQYLNQCPSDEDKERSVELMRRRGFPGCFGSWDCKHYLWRNCPKEMSGQYKGKDSAPTLIMEAICDAHMYIWYFHFGEPGSLNDINMLDKSSIVGSILTQNFDTNIKEYSINGTTRDYMYFLVDGIYPAWSIFAKTINLPVNELQSKYSSRHEHVRKDIERCFGVLVSKYHILQRPLRGWYIEDIRTMVNCCIILHNMTIESRRNTFVFNDLISDQEEEPSDNVEDTIFIDEGAAIDLTYSELFALRTAYMSSSIEDQDKHVSLRDDLMQYINKHF
jgi:hypothetical protein